MNAYFGIRMTFTNTAFPADIHFITQKEIVDFKYNFSFEQKLIMGFYGDIRVGEI